MKHNGTRRDNTHEAIRRAKRKNKRESETDRDKTRNSFVWEKIQKEERKNSTCNVKIETCRVFGNSKCFSCHYKRELSDMGEWEKNGALFQTLIHVMNGKGNRENTEKQEATERKKTAEIV